MKIEVELKVTNVETGRSCVQTVTGGLPAVSKDHKPFTLEGNLEDLPIPFLVNCFAVYASAVHGDIPVEQLKEFIKQFKQHFLTVSVHP
jgi:hypothetical protein